MPMWNIIPTCPDPMSCYTLVALCAFVTVGGGVATIAYWWVSHEFKCLKDGIKGHDSYIEDTTEIINKIQIELAVQESSMVTLKKDIAEIKTDVKTLLTR